MSVAKQILVVEDERVVARDIQRSLIDLGYAVPATAASADDAIRLASERCPDLVLMDIRIKGDRDGIETAEILQKRFGIPVVYLTAYADAATLERVKATEPLGYLLKPVKPRELRSVVEIALHRHEIEKRLRERERWFSTTLRSIADAVVTVDLAGKVTFMNAAAEGLIGLKAEDAVGQSAADVVRLEDRRPPATDATPLATALRMKQSVGLGEASMRNFSTGMQRSITDSAAPVIDGDEILGAVMVFRDVTEKEKLQKQLEFADRLASLGTMAAGVAHELNNPLAIVVTNASLMAEELQLHRAEMEIDASAHVAEQRLEKISKSLDDLQSAAGRMARIVSDLRIFSRPPEIAPEAVDLVRCVEWAVRATAHEFAHRAQLVTSFGNTPQVGADEAKLGQVVINLLINAAHSILPGQTDRNEVRVVTRADERGRAVIEISDTGMGIAPDALGRIFEPFFTTKPVGIGTGLGLAVCHGIVTSMEGEIQVESEVGKGTIFRIVLPAARPAKIVADAATVISGTGKPLRGRILVVDDDEMMLRAVEQALKGADHQVVCKESAREALALIESGARFDIILSDVMMPIMTGMEFYETLVRVDPDLARRVVFVSGGAVTDKVDAFLQSVANPQIEKPFRVAHLRELVQRLLVGEQAPLEKLAS